jgi:hypothetical protein
MGSTIAGGRDLSLHRRLAIPESGTNYTSVLCLNKRISRRSMQRVLVDLLGNLDGIVDLDAEIANGAHNL